MTRKFRPLWIVLWIITTFPLTLTAQSSATKNIPLIRQSDLAPYGLTRVWFHQIGVQAVDGKVQDIFLEGGQLFVTTSDAKLHVLNSETGQWLWSRAMGNKAHPLTEPAVNSRIVAIHNNLTVYLFDRTTGKQLLEIPLPDAASAPCEISEHYLYVPMVNDTILIYVLKEAHAPPPVVDLTIKPFVHSSGDPGVDKIVRQFEDAKRLLHTAEAVPEKESDFALDSTHRIPITCPTLGTIRTKPVLLSQFYSWVLDVEEQRTHEIDPGTHQEFIGWATEQGFLYVATITQLSEEKVKTIYRVDSSGQTFFMTASRAAQLDRPGNRALLARPTQSQLYPINELDPAHILSHDVIVTGGRAAYVFAVESRTGALCWQYPTRGQLLEPIAVIGKDVYAPTADGILHVLDVERGKERWFTQNIKRFVAASQKRVYVLDRLNRLVCLDRATGATHFVYDVRRFDHCYFNLETDQIFLLTNGGLVQCLRERQFDPNNNLSLRHRISVAEFAESAHSGEMPHLWWMEEGRQRTDTGTQDAGGGPSPSLQNSDSDVE
jgi:outer membrane protein assembly factor BamB